MHTASTLQKTNVRKVYMLFALVIVIWGFSWPMNKIGMNYIPPIWFAAIRLTLATLTMFIIVGVLKKLVLPSKQDLPILLTVGIFQMGFFTMLINLGLFYVDAGRSAILTYTTSFWILPIAVCFFKETLNWLKGLGLLFGMLGVLTLFSPWSIDWSDSDQLLGNGLLLLAAISFGISLLCARNMTWHRPALSLLPWQLLVGTIPVFLLAVTQVPHPEMALTQTAILTLLYTALLGTAFAYWCTTIISKELPSVTVSVGFLGVPISGLLFSSLILHEPITLPIKIAMILIPSGLLCMALGSKR